MNNYGMDGHDVGLQIQKFANKFSSLFKWKSDKEKAIFVVTVQNILRWTDRSDKFAGDFCSTVGFDHEEFNRLMSRMFYEWEEYVGEYKKRNSTN